MKIKNEHIVIGILILLTIFLLYKHYTSEKFTITDKSDDKTTYPTYTNGYILDSQLCESVNCEFTDDAPVCECDRTSGTKTCTKKVKSEGIYGGAMCGTKGYENPVITNDCAKDCKIIKNKIDWDENSCDRTKGIKQGTYSSEGPTNGGTPCNVNDIKTTGDCARDCQLGEPGSWDDCSKGSDGSFKHSRSFPIKVAPALGGIACDKIVVKPDYCYKYEGNNNTSIDPVSPECMNQLWTDRGCNINTLDTLSFIKTGISIRDGLKDIPFTYLRITIQNNTDGLGNTTFPDDKSVSCK